MRTSFGMSTNTGPFLPVFEIKSASAIALGKSTVFLTKVLCFVHDLVIPI